MAFVEDETWHEEARMAACNALAWCATPNDMKEIAKRAIRHGKDANLQKVFISACYANTLSLRPVPELQDDLVELLMPETPEPLKNAIARALGSAPLEKAARDELFEKMKSDGTRSAAALALILGGDASAAVQAVALFGELRPETLADLKDSYFRAFGFWNDEDLSRGNLYRWVENAEAIARVKLDGPQTWAVDRLQAQLSNLAWDNGPRSETRVVLRQRLIEDAKAGDEKKKAHAISTLRFMKEQGVLMMLSDERGLTGELAKVAHHALRFPPDHRRGARGTAGGAAVSAEEVARVTMLRSASSRRPRTGLALSTIEAGRRRRVQSPKCMTTSPPATNTAAA